MNRSTLFCGLFATALSVLFVCPVLARQGTKMDPKAKTMTIEGAVRDLACPVQNPAGTATSFSRQCTLDCVKHGSPIIILTKDGLIYFPISADMPDSGQRAKMMPFVGKYVQATGAVFERKGLALSPSRKSRNSRAFTSTPTILNEKCRRPPLACLAPSDMRLCLLITRHCLCLLTTDH